MSSAAERAERARNGSRRRRDLAALPAGEAPPTGNAENAQIAEGHRRFFSAVDWCRENVPELDAHLAASSALMIRRAGGDLTADAVRGRLRAQGRAR